jgi:hypothetical protein
MSVADYLDAQQSNLGQLKRLPHYSRLLEPIDAQEGKGAIVSVARALFDNKGQILARIGRPQVVASGPASTEGKGHAWAQSARIKSGAGYRASQVREIKTRPRSSGG